MKSLYVEYHPKKIWSGKINKNFAFLNLRISSATIRSSMQRVSRHGRKIDPLYEQGANQNCIEEYLHRWSKWCSLVVTSTLTIVSLSIPVAYASDDFHGSLTVHKEEATIQIPTICNSNNNHEFQMPSLSYKQLKELDTSGTDDDLWTFSKSYSVSEFTRSMPKISGILPVSMPIKEQTDWDDLSYTGSLENIVYPDGSSIPSSATLIVNFSFRKDMMEEFENRSLERVYNLSLNVDCSGNNS